MDLNEARQVIEALANGVDPRTGEVVEAESVLEAAMVTRALHAALQAIDARIRREKSRQGLPSNAGRSWTREEDLELTRGFKLGESVRHLATSHGRTRGAIIARLERLGEIAGGEADQARGDGRPAG